MILDHLQSMNGIILLIHYSVSFKIGIIIIINSHSNIIKIIRKTMSQFAGDSCCKNHHFMQLKVQAVR